MGTQRNSIGNLIQGFFEFLGRHGKLQVSHHRIHFLHRRLEQPCPLVLLFYLTLGFSQTFQPFLVFRILHRRQLRNHCLVAGQLHHRRFVLLLTLGHQEAHMGHLSNWPCSALDLELYHCFYPLEVEVMQHQNFDVILWHSIVQADFVWEGQHQQHLLLQTPAIQVVDVAQLIGHRFFCQMHQVLEMVLCNHLNLKQEVYEILVEALVVQLTKFLFFSSNPKLPF